jgi:hypothetical protein
MKSKESKTQLLFLSLLLVCTPKNKFFQTLVSTWLSKRGSDLKWVASISDCLCQNNRFLLIPKCKPIRKSTQATICIILVYTISVHHRHIIDKIRSFAFCSFVKAQFEVVLIPANPSHSLPYHSLQSLVSRYSLSVEW